jgi:predicted alpha/beta superfamily hydrolase
MVDAVTAMTNREPARAVTVPGAFQFDLTCDGAVYRLFVSKPETPPPPGGYPVIYALDGNAHFLSLVASARSQSARPDVTGTEPGVIVAIGYPIDGDIDFERRMLDFTPNVSPDRLGTLPGRRHWPATGGADALIRRIERHIKPEIEARIPIDHSRQSLFGHSLGGLFTLSLALTEPQLFSSYFASSPSLWFGQKHVFTLLDGAERQLQAIGRSLHITLSAGATEGARPAGETKRSEEMVAWTRGNDMLGNLRNMRDRLATIPNDILTLHYHEFEGEHHGSASAVAISRAIAVAFKS